MKIRIIPRENDEVQLIGEVQSGKGSKKLTGHKVKREDLRAETTRLVQEMRKETGLA